MFKSVFDVPSLHCFKYFIEPSANFIEPSANLTEPSPNTTFTPPEYPPLTFFAWAGVKFFAVFDKFFAFVRFLVLGMSLSFSKIIFYRGSLDVTRARWCVAQYTDLVHYCKDQTYNCYNHGTFNRNYVRSVETDAAEWCAKLDTALPPDGRSRDDYY